MNWDRRTRAGVARAAFTLGRDLIGRRLFGAGHLRPLYAVWYVTLRCNLACAFCDDGLGSQYPAVHHPELSAADGQRLLGIIRQGCGSIYFSGGEPLVRKDFDNLLATARNLDFWPIFVNTNLSLPGFSGDTLKEADVLIVSLGSTDETGYDRIIGRPGHTRRILDNLRICAQAQQRGGPQVVVNCVISAGRVEDARSVWELCRQLRVWFSPVPENQRAYIDPSLPLAPDYEKLVEDVLAAKKRNEWIYGSLRGLETLLRGRRFRCYPTLAPHIYPNGDLFYPCHPLRQKAANLIAIGSFAEAWRMGAEQFAPMPACDNRCHLPCYVNANGWIEHPFEMTFENFKVCKAASC